MISQVGFSPCSRTVLIKTGEKALEEKEKEKREETPAASETTDNKEKPEVSDVKKGTLSVCEINLTWKSFFYPMTPLLCFSITEEVKGERDAGKEVRAAREDLTRGNGRLLMERPRFMFNIADGGFTGQY